MIIADTNDQRLEARKLARNRLLGPTGSRPNIRWFHDVQPYLK